jgi:hypothetical protein
MEFLTPLVGLYVAAAAVPLLLLLYFLKLKRRETLVSSTLLWKRAVRDLQVNAPFQRLRRNLLLLLQLLALIAMLLTLAGPVASLSRGPGQRYVLLIDRSASMNATDVAPTRLDEAKKQAKVFVDSMRSGSAFSLRDVSDHAMVIAFDRHGKVMCGFTSDKPRLVAAIDAIEPGDGGSALGEAVTVARAFSQSSNTEGDGGASRESARLLLFSDGRIGDLSTIDVASDELIFHCVGRSEDNVAVTAMKARRSYEQPEQVEVFATLSNYTAQPVTTDVQLGVDSDVRAVRSVTIPACTTGQEGGNTSPGQTAVNFMLSHETAGVVEVRQLTADSLACDDVARAVLPAPKRLSVLLVTAGNPILESAFRACSIARLDPCTPAGFDAMDPASFEAQHPYDVIVLDNCTPAHLPRGRYLVWGPPPSGIDVNSPGKQKDQMIVDWRSGHPILQYVNLTNLFAAETWSLDLPRDAEVLAEFSGSPAISLLRRHGGVFLLVSFDVLQSNWPFEPGFVLFCYNAIHYLAAQAGTGQSIELAVAEPILLENVSVQDVVTIIVPDGSSVQVRPDPSGVVRFPGTQRSGLYKVAAPNMPLRMYAVSLLDVEESGIGPRSDLVFSNRTATAQQQGVQRANVPLWPFCVLAAMVLACVEWLAYNSRVRL